MTTEEQIVNAARKVFVRKGLQGAKMQEIADEAGINKALLHYYFRSKDKLFDHIFTEAFQQIIPSLRQSLNEKADIVVFIQFFVPFYLNFIQKNPYLPQFIMHELSQNPERIAGLAHAQNFPFDSLKVLIDRAIKEQQIRFVEPENLIINMLALTIFPFVARPMIEQIIFKGKQAAYENFMQKRADDIIQTILTSLRPI
ncbi:MAG: TetR/AcrR family transcriptional regulator [Bacteroidetes bacterium]|jgi:TetR/AcrR family transcriptional regulator|nr:TetR/AcrR family transcriptional regulator [Bacteroidota bacterium]